MQEIKKLKPVNELPESVQQYFANIDFDQTEPLLGSFENGEWFFTSNVDGYEDDILWVELEEPNNIFDSYE